jgi:hypothetical protein
MKIEVNYETHELLLSEVYNGVGLNTDAGIFVICQRDAGIEIRLGDGLWYAWNDNHGPKLLPGQGWQRSILRDIDGLKAEIGTVLGECLREIDAERIIQAIEKRLS